MNVYLASEFGYSKVARDIILPKLKKKIQLMGHKVYEPFENENKLDKTQINWMYEANGKDLNALKKCDAIVAVVNGTPPDVGVSVDIGVAIGLNKKIILIRDDFRTCTDSGIYPLNLMLFAGMPRKGWENFYLKSFSELDQLNEKLNDNAWENILNLKEENKVVKTNKKTTDLFANKMTIYLANNYGFSESAKQKVLYIFKDKLEKLGHTVLEPFEKNNQIDKINDPNWAYDVGQADLNDVKKSDAVFAVVNDKSIDEGIGVEIGLAVASYKKVFLFRDDIRNEFEKGLYPINRKLFYGQSLEKWKNSYFQSIEALDKKKPEMTNKERKCELKF